MLLWIKERRKYETIAGDEKKKYQYWQFQNCLHLQFDPLRPTKEYGAKIKSILVQLKCSVMICFGRKLNISTGIALTVVIYILKTKYPDTQLNQQSNK